MLDANKKIDVFATSTKSSQKVGALRNIQPPEISAPFLFKDQLFEEGWFR